MDCPVIDRAAAQTADASHIHEHGVAFDFHTLFVGVDRAEKYSADKTFLSRGLSRNAAMEAKAAVGQSVAAKDVRSVDVASSARRTEREAGLLTNTYSSLLRSHKGGICHKK